MSIHWAPSLADMEEVACGGHVHVFLADGEDVTDNWENVDCKDCLMPATQGHRREAEMAVFKGDKGELILLVSTEKRQRMRWTLVCFGRKRHYRKDGTCKHTVALLGNMRPWYRSRTDVDVRGGADHRNGAP